MLALKRQGRTNKEIGEMSNALRQSTSPLVGAWGRGRTVVAAPPTPRGLVYRQAHGELALHLTSTPWIRHH